MNSKYFSIKNNMLDIHVQVPQWYGHFYHNNSIKLKKYLLSIRIQISSDMNFIVMLNEALKKNKLISKLVTQTLHVLMRFMWLQLQDHVCQNMF